MRLRNSVLLLAAAAVLLSACGPTRNQPPRGSERAKFRVAPPKTAADATRYATLCEDFGPKKGLGANLIGMIHCQSLANSKLGTADQRYIANLRVCQISKIDAKTDVREGLSHCWEALELRPDSGEAYRARGMALARSKHYEQSLPDITKAIGLGEGDDPKIYSARSFIRGAMKDYSGGIGDAITARRKYADKGETPPVAVFALQSHMHMNAKQFSDAKAVIAAGREIEAENPDLYRMEALVELEEGNLAGGLKAINQAIKLKPTTAASYAIRGSIYGRQGNLEGMARDYRVAVRYDRNWSDLSEAVKKVEAIFALSKEALRTLGHDPGSKGPELTAGARNAMLAFQKSRNLAQDGKFNDPTVTTLMRAADGNSDPPPQQDPLDIIKRLMQDPKTGGGKV